MLRLPTFNAAHDSRSVGHVLPVGRPMADETARASEAVCCWLVGWAAFVAWALLQGRDITFDALNHHFYLGAVAADHGRMARDFLAAGLQAYQAPYAHLPLAAMTRALWPTWAVLATLATLQSLAIPALWCICAALFPAATAADRLRRLGAVAAALASPVVLGQIGSTFVDLTAAIPLLAAVALLLAPGASLPGGSRRIVAAGALAGISVALKLTNAPFAAALPVFTLLAGARVRPLQRLRHSIVLAASMAGAFALAYAPWGAALWSTRDNPFFPLFNGWFRSPDYPVHGTAHLRFMPADWVEAIARPLAMADPQANVYYEIIAPDLRPLAALIGLALVGWRIAAGHRCPVGLVRAAPLLCYIAVVWTAWLATTGNGRYFIPGLQLIGPALVAIFATGALPNTLAASSAALVAAGVLWPILDQPLTRWDHRSSAALSAPFLDVRIPEALASRPVTYVTIGSHAYGVLALAAHPDSPRLNLPGAWVVPPEGPGASSVLDVLSRASGLVVVAPAHYDPAPGTGSARVLPPDVGTFSDALSTYGIAVGNACLLDTRTALSIAPPPAAGAVPVGQLAGFHFCDARFDPDLRVRAIQAARTDPRKASIARAFDRIEDACPRIFAPARQATSTRGLWAERRYAASDTRLYVDASGHASYAVFGLPDPILLGPVGSILSPNWKAPCDGLPARYLLPWRRDR